ncbi:MAG: lipase family protein [Clostridia bacterium]|nr:lipase family protein [Clostridia bacterium]
MELNRIFERCLQAQYRQAAGEVNYAVERMGGQLWLFFEHSRSRADWANNLDFPIKPYRRMEDRVWYCHRGFLRAWRLAEPWIAAALAARPLERVTVAGYSHGAALAVLCHEYVWFHYPALRQALSGYGFACPRVVWGVPPKERWATFTVVRHRGDPVPRLPPAWLGYRHVGKVLTVGEGARGVQAHLPAAMRKALKGQ